MLMLRLFFRNTFAQCGRLLPAYSIVSLLLESPERAFEKSFLKNPQMFPNPLDFFQNMCYAKQKSVLFI